MEITRICLTKLQALVRAIRAKYEKLPDQHKPIALIIAGIIVCLSIIILFKCAQAVFGKNKHLSSEPLFIRQDKKIIVPKNSPLRAQMTLITVKKSAEPHIVSFPGIVEADPSRTVNILPPLTGRLMTLNVRLGEEVKKNQLLAVISSPDLALATSDNEKARSMLEFTNEALTRAKQVNHAGANSKKDIEQAQNNYLQALADANRTEANLKTLGNNSFTQLEIRSPIKGRVTALNYGRGSYITDPTAPLLTVSNIDEVWITAYIPENYIAGVAHDLPAQVILPAYPNRIWHGKVTFVNSFLEPDTRRNKTRLTFANPDGKLQPNMFATVNIALPQPAGVSIPISSILMNNDNTSIFVEISPGTYERHEIELGMEDKSNVQVLAGLKTGDRVVTSGGVLMND